MELNLDCYLEDPGILEDFSSTWTQQENSIYVSYENRNRFFYRNNPEDEHEISVLRNLLDFVPATPPDEEEKILRDAFLLPSEEREIIGDDILLSALVEDSSVNPPKSAQETAKSPDDIHQPVQIHHDQVEHEYELETKPEDDHEEEDEEISEISEEDSEVEMTSSEDEREEDSSDEEDENPPRKTRGGKWKPDSEEETSNNDRETPSESSSSYFSSPPSNSGKSRNIPENSKSQKRRRLETLKIKSKIGRLSRQNQLLKLRSYQMSRRASRVERRLSTLVTVLKKNKLSHLIPQS